MAHIITIHNVDRRFMDFYGDHLARTSKLRWRLTLDGSDVKVHTVCTAGVSAAAYQYANCQPAQSPRTAENVYINTPTYYSHVPFPQLYVPYLAMQQYQSNSCKFYKTHSISNAFLYLFCTCLEFCLFSRIVLMKAATSTPNKRSFNRRRRFPELQKFVSTNRDSFDNYLPFIFCSFFTFVGYTQFFVSLFSFTTILGFFVIIKHT